MKTRTFLVALLILVAPITSGCGLGAKETLTALGKGAIDCLESSAMAAADGLGPILRPAIVQTFASGNPDTRPFVALGKQAGTSVMRCAIASAFAAVATGFERAPKTQAQQIDPAQVRAAFHAVSVEVFGGATFVTPEGKI